MVVLPTHAKSVPGRELLVTLGDERRNVWHVLAYMDYDVSVTACGKRGQLARSDTVEDRRKAFDQDGALTPMCEKCVP